MQWKKEKPLNFLSYFHSGSPSLFLSSVSHSFLLHLQWELKKKKSTQGRQPIPSPPVLVKTWRASWNKGDAGSDVGAPTTGKVSKLYSGFHICNYTLLQFPYYTTYYLTQASPQSGHFVAWCILLIDWLSMEVCRDGRCGDRTWVNWVAEDT